MRLRLGAPVVVAHLLLAAAAVRADGDGPIVARGVPCYDSDPAYAALMPRQQFLVNGDHTVESVAAGNWSVGADGVAVDGRPLGFRSNSIRSNLEVWVSTTKGAQIAYESVSKTFRLKPKGGFNRLAAADLCLDLSPHPVTPCTPASPASSLPFCRGDLPRAKRVADLVDRVEPDEVQKLLVNGALACPGSGSSRTTGGARRSTASRPAARRPTTARAAAPRGSPRRSRRRGAFNATLFRAVGSVIGAEARALANEGVTNGFTFWSPNLNILRDQRWGRARSARRDPRLNGKYGENFVLGFEHPDGSSGDAIAASACPKHFFAYNLENCFKVKDNCRHTFDMANLSQGELEATYLPPFEQAISSGKASGLMCSYNAVNGTPSCANAWGIALAQRSGHGFDLKGASLASLGVDLNCNLGALGGPRERDGQLGAAREWRRAPFDRWRERVAVLGPCGDVFKGGYSGNFPTTSVADALRALDFRVAESPGCVADSLLAGNAAAKIACVADANATADAVAAARAADVVVLALGVSQDLEQENFDFRARRRALALAGHANPSGRLPMTWYAQNFYEAWTAPALDPYTGAVNASSANASYFDASLLPNNATGNPGRTYRYYTKTPVYAFGAGRSYSNVTSALASPADAAVDVAAVAAHAAEAARGRASSGPRRASTDVVVYTLEVVVTNEGPYAGAQTLLVFAAPPAPGVDGAPLEQLIDFAKTKTLAVGASMTLRVPIHAHDLTLVDAVRAAAARPRGPVDAPRVRRGPRARDVRVRLRVR
ncbi:xylan 1,4-beta-xylosidase [Aureococcus anophagefferens]|uniref:Xylan 1,4-beta-xylosidase n=1 Tax=Aureococcus anophagefferens TaxID=44056 RepID=A0ABR1FGS1_AURAN